MHMPLLKKIQIENKRLRTDINTLPSVKGTGENLTLNGTSDARFKKFEISGNSYQDGEPSFEFPSEVKSCGDNGNINFKISDNVDEEQPTSIPVQKPFRAVETTRDTFIKQNGKRYEKHIIRRHVFSGKENWFWLEMNKAYELNGANVFEGILYDSTLFNKKIECESNIYPANRLYMLHLADPRTAEIQIPPLNFPENDVNAFKELLQNLADTGTPAYIDYVADEPELIECTDEQNEVLDKIEDELHSYKDVTHIFSEDEVSPNFDVEAIVDLDSYINRKLTATSTADEVQHEEPSFEDEVPNTEDNEIIGGEN